jgi:hypothetical protein
LEPTPVRILKYDQSTNYPDHTLHVTLDVNRHQSDKQYALMGFLGVSPEDSSANVVLVPWHDEQIFGTCAPTSPYNVRYEGVDDHGALVYSGYDMLDWLITRLGRYPYDDEGQQLRGIIAERFERYCNIGFPTKEEFLVGLVDLAGCGGLDWISKTFVI